MIRTFYQWLWFNRGLTKEVYRNLDLHIKERLNSSYNDYLLSIGVVRADNKRLEFICE